jgi:hypothetical protein
VASYISDRGEIVGGGNPLGCTDNDTCNHVYVLIPCDEKHPGIEGCDYSIAAPAAVESKPIELTTDPSTVPPLDARNAMRTLLGRRQGFGLTLTRKKS